MLATTAEPEAPDCALGEEHFRRIGDLAQSAVVHLENADLVRRTEPVLHRPQDPVGVMPLPLELQDGVHHVLDHLRSGDHPFLGHVSDQKHRDVRASSQCA